LARSKKDIQKELVELLNENVGQSFYTCDLAAMLGVSEATVRRYMRTIEMMYPNSVHAKRYYGRTLYIIKAPIPQED
jgi:DeoR/GlpR family transcriptional regulator of sugar metabolism